MADYGIILEAVAKQLLIKGYTDPASRLLQVADVPEDEIDALTKLQPWTIDGMLQIASGRSSFSPNDYPHSVLVSAAGNVTRSADFEQLINAAHAISEDDSMIEAIEAIVNALPKNVLSLCLEVVRQDGTTSTIFARSMWLAAFLTRSDDLREMGVNPSNIFAEALSSLNLFCKEAEWEWRVVPWRSRDDTYRFQHEPRWAYVWGLAGVLRLARCADLDEDYNSVRHLLFDTIYHQLRFAEYWGEHMNSEIKRVVDTLSEPGLAERIGEELSGLTRRWSSITQ